MKLSLVVPCYNEEDNVNAFFEAALFFASLFCIKLQKVFVDCCTYIL